ncbi:MAG: response regulator [Syntrophales bacterium]|jgi:DNA-binding response OmpR family regulator|nr:response regulator [Syntrophales bacterium]MDD5532502.1 response regulator [Syntrophales bacterium]
MTEKLKVLIVEDHRVTQKLFDTSLNSKIFEKKFAFNGEEALALYREFKPDIILLDIMLPVVSGYAVLKEIREKEEDKSTVIIISSSLLSRQDIMDCARMGIQGYMIKPLNFRELAQKILEYYAKSLPERSQVVARVLKDMPLSVDSETEAVPAEKAETADKE